VVYTPPGRAKLHRRKDDGTTCHIVAHPFLKRLRTGLRKSWQADDTGTALRAVYLCAVRSRCRSGAGGMRAPDAGQPSGPAVVTGLVTWFVLTARGDLAPPPGR
jgi:hypothetical protein